MLHGWVGGGLVVCLKLAFPLFYNFLRTCTWFWQGMIKLIIIKIHKHCRWFSSASYPPGQMILLGNHGSLYSCLLIDTEHSRKRSYSSCTPPHGTLMTWAKLSLKDEMTKDKRQQGWIVRQLLPQRQLDSHFQSIYLLISTLIGRCRIHPPVMTASLLITKRTIEHNNESLEQHVYVFGCIVCLWCMLSHRWRCLFNLLVLFLSACVQAIKTTNNYQATPLCLWT